MTGKKAPGQVLRFSVIRHSERLCESVVIVVVNQLITATLRSCNWGLPEGGRVEAKAVIAIITTAERRNKVEGKAKRGLTGDKGKKRGRR